MRVKVYHSSSIKKIILSSVVVRTMSAIMQQTWFVPDEHWQSTEIAHNIVFGYGHLTWEWKVGIRSYLYPLCISILYKILDVLHFDTVLLLTFLPRFFHAMLAVVCDVFAYSLAKEEFGHGAADWTIFFLLSSWSMFYCMSRTIINSLETTLCTVSIYYFFKWCHKQNYRQWPVRFVFLSGLAVMFRPTSAIILLPLVIYHMSLSRNHIFITQQCYFIFSLIILSLTSIVDRICYGYWVLVPYNFLKFNLFQGLGKFYGSHPWYWYYTQGLVTILGSHIFLVALGILIMKKHLLTAVIAWTLFIYSLLEHKEFRFILPLVPLCMCLAGNYCNQSLYMKKHRSYVVTVLVLTNIFPAAYFSLLHQRGPIDLMKHLSTQAQNYGNRTNVLFLMPCHSTPYYSHLHQNISMKFLSCEPRLENHFVTDEADLFYEDPKLWLKNFLTRNIPSHISMYDVLLPKIQDLLDKHEYVLCKKFFHAHINEGRIGKELYLFCHKRLQI